jgi:hypothetical protein
VNTALRDEIMSVLDRLPERNLRVLADVLQRLPEGAALCRWSRVVGSVSDEDAEAMLRAVEEGCEQIEGAEEYVRPQ